MLKKQLSFYGASRVLVIGCQFIFVPIAISQIGIRDYGIFVLILQGALLIRLVALQSVAQVIIREYNNLILENDPEDIYFTTLSLVLLSFIIISVFIFSFSTSISSTFGINDSYILPMIGMGLALSWFGLKHTIIYCKNLRQYTALDISFSVSVIILSLVIGQIIGRIEAYVFAYLIVALFMTSILMRNKAARPIKRPKIIALKKNVINYGLPLMIGEVLSWLISVADRFQIAALLNAEQTGIYTAAYQIFVAPMNILGFAVALIIQPSVFASDKKEFKIKMKQANMLLGVLSLCCLLFMVLFGQKIFSLLIQNKAYIDLQLIIFLTLTGVANSYFQLELIAEKYSRKSKTILMVQVISAMLLLFGNWLFLPIFGIIAAAITSFSSYLVIIIILRILRDREGNNLPLMN